MQVPRYWRMKKHLYQLNGFQINQPDDVSFEQVTPIKEKSVAQPIVTTVERKSNLAIVA